MKLAFLLAVLLAVGVAVFSLQNSSPVVVRFLSFGGEVPIAGVALISFAIGVLVGWSGTLPGALSVRRRLRQAEAKLREAEAREDSGDTQVLPKL